MFTSMKLRLLCLLVDQRRRGDRQSTQGLTLIELMIVIVIIGILAAIASGSFLGAVTKAKGAEARTNLGAILRAQQQHYMERGEFARNLDELPLGITEVTTHYEYRVH
ncbi:MAG: type IV pilin protein, partial [Leptolyngbyaceae cyanobacterium]